MGDVATWVASIASVLALVLSVWAFVTSRRDARDAKADAARAADAAEKSAEAAATQAAIATAQAAKYRAPWRLGWVKGDTYQLINDGDEAVYDIEVVFPPHSAVRADGKNEIARLAPGSAHAFLVGLTMASPHRNIAVTWSRQAGGERHDWTQALPAKG